MRKWLCGVVIMLAGCQGGMIHEHTPVQMVWKKSVNRGYVAHDGMIAPTVGRFLWAGDSYGNIGAYHKKKGDLVWRTTLGHGLSASMTEDRGQLAVPLDTGLLVLVNSLNGHKLWQYQVKGRLLAPPVFSNQWVIVKTDMDHVYVLDRQDGKLLWHYHNDAPSLILHGASQPCVNGDSIIVGFASGHLARMRLMDGKVIWVRQVSEPSGQTQLARMRDIVASPLVHDNRVYWAAFQGGVGAYDYADGSTIWQHDSGSYASLSLRQGHLYMLSDTQQLMAFNEVDGELLWNNQQWEQQDDISSPFWAMGHLYLMKSGAFLYEVSPDGGQVIASMWLGRNDQLLGQLNSDGQALYGLTARGALIKALPEKR